MWGGRNLPLGRGYKISDAPVLVRLGLGLQLLGSLGLPESAVEGAQWPVPGLECYMQH